MITAGMGGVLSGQVNLTHLKHLLDVGCGTGGWLIETAKTYPTIPQLTGVDISHKMIEYAREQANIQQVHDRVTFLLMDALRMLEFPENVFDFVNMRFGQSFMRTWDWPKLLQEFLRVTRPGGIIQITETTLESTSTSPTLGGFQRLMAQAFYQAGHLFEEGVVAGLPKVLKQHGFAVQTRRIDMEYRPDTPEGHLFVQDLERIYRTAAPFLRKWTRVPENYDELYQQMLREVRHPDFVVKWPLITVWASRQKTR